jgi:hypothetical protein
VFILVPGNDCLVFILVPENGVENAEPVYPGTAGRYKAWQLSGTCIDAFQVIKVPNNGNEFSCNK